MASLTFYKAISDELVNNAADYGGMNDDQITATMNAVNKVAPVPVAEVSRYLGNLARYVRIRDSALDDAKNLMVRLDINFFEDIDLDDATVSKEIVSLVAGVLLTQEEADTLKALGDNRQSRAQQIGVGSVSNRDLGRMRTEKSKGLI